MAAGSKPKASAGPLILRLLKAAQPEIEGAALDVVAEVGEHLIGVEEVGRAGLAELGRIGGILRRARRRDPER